jgi:hypothetical protein
MWPFLPSKRKDGRRRLPKGSRSKQPEAPNSVLAAFQNMLCPAVNELLRRAPNVNLAMQFPVFVPEPRESLANPRNTTGCSPA